VASPKVLSRSCPPGGSRVKIDKCDKNVYCASMDIELRHYRAVGSTMDVARECIEGYSGSRLIILADEQTAGRGRIEGRTWVGRQGEALLMTFALKEGTAIPEAFPLKVGLAVFDVLSQMAVDFKRTESLPTSTSQCGEEPVFLIKWPNDILGLDRDSQGSHKKLCGILCEKSKGWLLAGIGINLYGTAYPDSLKDSATSLEEVLSFRHQLVEPHLPESEALARKIAGAVVSRVEDPDWKSDYIKNMWSFGMDVRFVVGHPIQGTIEHGSILGIDGTGRLLLRDESGGINAFISGEISNIRGL